MKHTYGRGTGCGNPRTSRRMLDHASSSLSSSYEDVKQVVAYTSGECYDELQSILNDYQKLSKKIQAFRDSLEV